MPDGYNQKRRSPYTDGLVVITQEMINTWMEDATLRRQAQHIYLSLQSDVFLNFTDEYKDVAIWRRKIPARAAKNRTIAPRIVSCLRCMILSL